MIMDITVDRNQGDTVTIIHVYMIDNTDGPGHSTVNVKITIAYIWQVQRN